MTNQELSQTITMELLEALRGWRRLGQRVRSLALVLRQLDPQALEAVLNQDAAESERVSHARTIRH